MYSLVIYHNPKQHAKHQPAKFKKQQQQKEKKNTPAQHYIHYRPNTSYKPKPIPNASLPLTLSLAYTKRKAYAIYLSYRKARLPRRGKKGGRGDSYMYNNCKRGYTTISM